MSISSRRIVKSRPPARYGFWVINSGAPTDEELKRVADRKIAIAIINTDRGDYAAKLKALDPGVKIYAYVCLSSSREWEKDVAIAGAVSYNDAVANGWLALDTNGNTIQWGDYGGHYQATVWDSNYQGAYCGHIDWVLRQSLYDGIWADNDLPGLLYNPSTLLAGTTTRAETDKKITDGLDSLVQQAGALAKSYGKILMPNYGDGRLTPARRRQHALAGGGANEEMFCNWIGSSEPAVYLWGDGDWTYQIGNIQNDQVDGCMTQVTSSADERTALYGYTSFLLKAKPGDAWLFMPPDMVQGVLPWMSFQDIKIGYPIEAYQTQGTSVYTRRFEHAFVAVNPSQSQQTVMLADGSTRTMRPTTGLLLPE